MVLVYEALLGVEDTDAPDYDVDDYDGAPLHEFRRCLQPMASVKAVRELRAWQADYFAR